MSERLNEQLLRKDAAARLPISERRAWGAYGLPCYRHPAGQISLLLPPCGREDEGKIESACRRSGEWTTSELHEQLTKGVISGKVDPEVRRGATRFGDDGFVATLRREASDETHIDHAAAWSRIGGKLPRMYVEQLRPNEEHTVVKMVVHGYIIALQRATYEAMSQREGVVHVPLQPDELRRVAQNLEHQLRPFLTVLFTEYPDVVATAVANYFEELEK